MFICPRQQCLQNKIGPAGVRTRIKHHDSMPVLVILTNKIPQKPKEASALCGVEVERALGEVLEPVVLLEPFKGLLDGGVCLGSGS